MRLGDVLTAVASLFLITVLFSYLLETGHYECSPTTIMQAYEKAFKYLSVNHGMQARQDLRRMDDTVIGLSDVIKKQQEEIVKLRTILEQHNIQFQKMTTDFNERLTWLENKLKKKEKVKFH